LDSRGQEAAHEAELRRELGVGDLLLAQILVIVGGTWVGTAGKLGPAHLIYWLVASALFFVPLVATVLFLNRWAPLEGGLYQWAKLAMGPAVGFLVAFNVWLWAIVLLAGTGLDVITALAYAFEGLAWMRHDAVAAPVASVLVTAVLAAATLGGLRVGKRVHAAGGIVRLGVYALLLALPLVALLLGRPVRHEAATVAMPPPTLLSVNILAKMGFGAFSGFEYVAIFAGESRSPERSFARAVHLAAPLVIVMFVAGTAAVLSFAAPAEIDLIAPIPQVLGLATAGFGPAAHLASAAVVLLVVALLAQCSATLTGITRLPMVAGWDGLLPAWFTRLSPRTRVPVNSILFVSAAIVVVALSLLAGVGHQEAYQLFSSACMVFYALTYLVMFAIPILGRGEGMPRPPAWLMVAATSGFAMTLLFVVLAVFPIVKVRSEAMFGVKVVAIVVAANLAGVGLYAAGARARRAGADAR
jgi:amino acid transporter